MASPGDWTAVDALTGAVLREHDGVVHIETLLARGLTRRQVAAVFRRGVLNRPRIGWYADPALPWQGRHAVRVGGVLDCVSAAASYGIPVPPGSHRILHVRMPRNAPRVRHNRDRTWQVAAGDDPEVRLHWTDAGHPVGWRAGLVDTLLQLGDCVPPAWFVVAMDHVLHRPRGGEPLLSAAQYADLERRLPQRLRDMLALVDPRSESPIETLLRLGLVRRGIGPFDLQVQVHPDHRVDILVGEHLVLEADGEAFHDADADRRRDEVLVRCGFRVLRFSYDRIVSDLDAVLDEIEAALFTA